MWVVYREPADYPPGSWVARRWAIYDLPQPTPEVIVATRLAALDELFLERGYTRLERSPDDEPHVVCTWV